MIPGLYGKTAFIVGATGGLGWACAQFLATCGCNLVIHGRSREKTETLSAELLAKSRGITVTPVIHDFSVQSMDVFFRTIKDIPPPGVLVPSFGPFCQKPLEMHSPEDWIAMSTLDLALPGALVSSFLPAMRENDYGRILFWGGTQNDVIRYSKTNCAYSAAKTGLLVLARSIAATQADRNIAALVACPGFVETEYVDKRSIRKPEDAMPDKNPRSARETAETAMSLLLDKGHLLNGSAIRLDGGLVFS